MRTVTDELYDNEWVGEDDSVVETVDVIEGVPDPRCDAERVRQADAVKETVPLRHKLAVADGDLVDNLVVLTVALCGGLLEIVPDADSDADVFADCDADGESVGHAGIMLDTSLTLAERPATKKSVVLADAPAAMSP